MHTGWFGLKQYCSLGICDGHINDDKVDHKRQRHITLDNDDDQLTRARIIWMIIGYIPNYANGSFFWWKSSFWLNIGRKWMVWRFLFIGFYLKYSEWKVGASEPQHRPFERKKFRTRPLCHPKNPPTNPFVLFDMSLFLYRKEKGTKLKVKVGIQQ